MADKAYKVIIEGTDGRGSQVFEAETPEELQDKFKEAQTHATAKIAQQDKENTELKQRLATLEASIEPAPAANGNPDNAWRKEFFKQGLTEILGVPVEDFIKDYTQTVRPGAELSKINAVNAAFVQKHPELIQVSPEDDLHNANTMRKIIADNGWDYSEKSLNAAFAVAKVEGQLKLPVAEPEGALPPVPTTVTRPSVQVNTDKTEKEFLTTAPTEKVREYLEKKFAAKHS